MLSRTAENLFWMARSMERAENTARVLEVNHTLLLDFHVPVEQQWRPLLIISGVHDYKDEPTAENVQEFMTWDRDNPFSIASSLASSAFHEADRFPLSNDRRGWFCARRAAGLTSPASPPLSPAPDSTTPGPRTSTEETSGGMLSCR